MAINYDTASALLNNATNLFLEVQEYKMGGDRNSYFNDYRNIYDSMMENFEDLTFYVDITAELRNEFDYNPNSTIEEFINLTSYTLDDLSDFDKQTNEQQYEIAEMNLEELKEFNETIYNSLISFLDNLTDEDIDIRNDGSILFDCDYIDERADSCTYEALAYWTIYFEPQYFDAEVAQKVGLLPFEYEGIELLALGGCGMDLSPKLDAYVALVHNHIPQDSKFFKQKDYFEYVAGKAVTQEIEEKCKLKNPHYILSFDKKEVKTNE